MSSRQDLVDVLQAALNGELAFLPLDHAPPGKARYPVRIYGPDGETTVDLVAQIAGDPMGDVYPVVLMVSTARQTQKLELLVETLESTPSGVNAIADDADRSSETIARGDLAPMADDEDLSGREIGGGRYRIEHLLGVGGMGRVYLAQHVSLAKRIAIKVLDASYASDPLFTARFHQEALAASQLDHRNAMSVLDFGEEPDGLLFIAMELLEGESLAQVLGRERLLPEGRVLAIMVQVCAALAAAHGRGIVHRDIKPENIVIQTRTNDDGDTVEFVKVCDFGLAKMQSVDTARAKPSGPKLTMAGQVMGTPDYMAPEQCRGDVVDARCDIYACGVLLYEMITGRIPFEADNPMEVLGMHIMTPPVPPSEHEPMDPRLEATILKALEKAPERRQQTVRELREELRAIARAPRGQSEGPIVLESDPATSVAPSHAGASSTPPLSPSQPRGSEPYVSHGLGSQPEVAQVAPPPPGVVPGDSSAPKITPVPYNADPLAAAATPGKGSSGQHRLDGLARQLDFGDAEEMRPSHIPIDMDKAPASLKAAGAHPGSSAPPSAAQVEALAEQARASLGRDPALRKAAYRRLLDANVSGFWALMRARQGQTFDDDTRKRWVSMIRDFSQRGLAAVPYALSQIDLTHPAGVDDALAEDLLHVAYVAKDPQAVVQVARFVSYRSPLVRRAALTALIQLAPPDLPQLMLRGLEDRDAGVRLLVTRAFRKIGRVGGAEVERLKNIIEDAHAPDEVRASAAYALARVEPNAQADAELVLLHAIEGASRSPSFVRMFSGKTGEDGPLFLEAAAKVLLRLSGPEVKSAVRKRAKSCKGEARERLERVLATH